MQTARKWRGTPLADLTTPQIEEAIDYCGGMLNALWHERQKRIFDRKNKATLTPIKQEQSSGKEIDTSGGTGDPGPRPAGRNTRR